MGQYKLTMSDIYRVLTQEPGFDVIFSPFSYGEFFIFSTENRSCDLGKIVPPILHHPRLNYETYCLLSSARAMFLAKTIRGIKGCKRCKIKDRSISDYIGEPNLVDGRFWMEVNAVELRALGLNTAKFLDRLAYFYPREVIDYRPHDRFLILPTGPSPKEVITGEHATVYYLEVGVEPTNDLMIDPRVDYTTTISTTNIHEAASILGIHGCSNALFRNLEAVMSGFETNPRHNLMIARHMTNYGELTAVNYYGSTKIPIGTSNLASLEHVNDVLTVRGFIGSSESIVSNPSLGMYVGARALIGPRFDKYLNGNLYETGPLKQATSEEMAAKKQKVYEQDETEYQNKEDEAPETKDEFVAGPAEEVENEDIDEKREERIREIKF
jgi:hypothetical protein